MIVSNESYFNLQMYFETWRFKITENKRFIKKQQMLDYIIIIIIITII